MKERPLQGKLNHQKKKSKKTTEDGKISRAHGLARTNNVKMAILLSALPFLKKNSHFFLATNIL
jgi:hypothetical protein